MNGELVALLAGLRALIGIVSEANSRKGEAT
jgi:hypothetical protein